MKNKGAFALFVFMVVFGIGLFCTYAVHNDANPAESGLIAALAFVIALLAFFAVKIANPGDKIDIRVIGTAFKAGETFAKDTAPPSSIVRL